MPELCAKRQTDSLHLYNRALSTHRIMISLFFRNLLFTILQPGIVAGLIPYLIVRNSLAGIAAWEFTPRHYVGFTVFVLGFVIMIACIASFAIYGRGTLSPADPTKRLVVQGLYRYSRNPMYVGVMMMLVGECIFFQSGTLWLYTVGVFVMFNLFIRYIEEPRLKRDFGDEYVGYSRRVRKWV